MEQWFEIVKSNITHVAHDPVAMCKSNLGLQCLFAICFAITSCTVYYEDSPGAGWSLILVNSSQFFSIIANQKILNQRVPSKYLQNQHRYEMLYFVMLGCDFVCTLISLMTAVYWGQLANCESPPFKIRTFQCGNKK